jgi:DNA-binding transcriptional LysR family regulator
MAQSRASQVQKKSPKIETIEFPLPQKIQQLELGDIEAFLALIRSGCANPEAAEKLKCSIPEVSRRRRAVANAIGEVVSYHHLTPRGKIFRPYGEQIIQSIHAALKMLDRAKRRPPGAIQIGYLHTPVCLFYTQTCQRFNERYSTEIVVENPWGHECVKKVQTGALELALVANPFPMKLPREVRYSELVRYRMFCAVGTSKPHPFCNRQSVSLREMKEHVVLMMAKEAKLYTRHIRMFFSKVGGLRRVRYCPDAVAQIDKLISGEGVALVMYPFGHFVANKPIKLIPIEPPIFLGVGALFSSPVHRAIFDFVEIARDVINAQMKSNSGNAKIPDPEYSCILETEA